MNETHFDVIVAGVGAMGSATCLELARRKVSVLGLEQFGIAHDRGSSHGRSRMIRLAYYEHPDYVPLLRRAYENWRKLEYICGQRILYVTGGVYVGPQDGELVSGSLCAAREHQLAHELLDRGELARRIPPLQVPDDFVALYEPEAGFLLPERAIEQFSRHAIDAGAQIHVDEPIRTWSSGAGGVTVATDCATYHADHLILCGGAWSSALARDPGIELPVTRQVMGWVAPRDPAPFALDRFPVWAVDRLDGTLDYGFPIGPHDANLKMAHHAPGPPCDPDHVSRMTTSEDSAEIRQIVTRLVPDAAGPVVETRICLYTLSPDYHFIIGRHPRHPRVTLACGFSGHGFKFASVIGEVLADLATAGKTRWPVGFLSPGRFAGGQ
jgi:sarcosine oxidase